MPMSVNLTKHYKNLFSGGCGCLVLCLFRPLNPYSSKIPWIFDSNFVLDLSAICFIFLYYQFLSLVIEKTLSTLFHLQYRKSWIFFSLT